MKVKIIASDKSRIRIKERLKTEDLLEVNEDYEIIIRDPQYTKKDLIGKTNSGDYVIIKPSQIAYVESFGHEIICHTLKDEFTIKEKLYEVEELFNQYGFIRVHKSYVINKNFIATIKPTLNTKFILTMKNGEVIDVTRNYYYIFKSKIGM